MSLLRTIGWLSISLFSIALGVLFLSAVIAILIEFPILFIVFGLAAMVAGFCWFVSSIIT